MSKFDNLKLEINSLSKGDEFRKQRLEDFLRETLTIFSSEGEMSFRDIFKCSLFDMSLFPLLTYFEWLQENGLLGSNGDGTLFWLTEDGSLLLKYLQRKGNYF